MSEIQQSNQPFRTSSRSRKRVRRRRNWLAIPLILLLLLMCAALFFVIRYFVKGGGASPESSSASEVTTQVPAATDAPTSEHASDGTEATSQDEPPTEGPSEATAEPAPTATEPAAEGFHLYTAEELLPLPADIDRGLLKDISADDSNGTWWFGSMVRDLETGVVTPGYDRSAETLALIDKYDAIYRKNTDQKVCYLTFDCGYENGNTAPILDALKEKGVKAVFFVTGDYVTASENKELLLRMVNEGHIIGSHTDHHLCMPKLDDETFIDELNNLQLKLNEALGYEYQIHFYRPPEGATNERDLALARKMDITTVLWSYAYGDYNPNNQMEVSAALEKAEKGLHDGCVYLLHAVSSTNAAMLGDLIDYMQSQGYDVRRIDQ